MGLRENFGENETISMLDKNWHPENYCDLIIKVV